MNKFRNAAIQILEKSGSPLHYTEITRIALEEGILQTEGATPEASMNAQISVDIKQRGNQSDFIRTAPSIYTINPNREVIPQIEVVEEAIETVEVDSGYTGKAGEYFVCSELLFRGYNASIMSVDTGLDIIAAKDNKIYGIQVKTANVNQYQTYNFNIRKVSFSRHDASNVYYVFVLRSSAEKKVMILPVHELEKKIHEKAILEVKSKSLYRVAIKIRDGHVYLGNMGHNMDYYLNNWDIIK